MTTKDFSRFLNSLANKGVFVAINRMGRRKKKLYEVVVNFEVIKTYKTRRSAKKYIAKNYQL